MKINQINEQLLEARKSSNNLIKSLLSTFKGECETISKNQGNSIVTDEIVETVAKKMVKSAETINTEESKQEIIILKTYLPALMTGDLLREKINNIFGDNYTIVEEVKNGNKGKMGMLMGLVMKETKGIADAKEVSQIINTLLMV